MGILHYPAFVYVYHFSFQNLCCCDICHWKHIYNTFIIQQKRKPDYEVFFLLVMVCVCHLIKLCCSKNPVRVLPKIQSTSQMRMSLFLDALTFFVGCHLLRVYEVPKKSCHENLC
jgi:hypothetical protein